MNWVQDILFRQSEDQLDDIVDQLYNGRTCIKSSLEIGLMNRAKQECQKSKADQFAIEIKDSEVTDKNDKSDDIDTKEHEDSALIPGDKAIEIIADDSPAPQPTTSPKHNSTRKGSAASRSITNRLSAESRVADMLFEDALNYEKRVNNASLHDIEETDIYAPSNKPWEQIDESKNYTTKRMWYRFFVVMYKIVVSYSELFCYAWMILTTILKPGLLYLIYPILIFGYALLEEQKPGRYFWYFIVFYTQLLIALNFAVQLDLWDVLLSESAAQRANEFFDKTNLGIQPYAGDNFDTAFEYYFAEIFLLFFVMVHILKESLAGVFDVSYDEYETFEDGLMRYRLQTLCNTEEERKEVTG